MEKIIMEINPRTKEKKLVNVLELDLYDDFTVTDLLNEHNDLKKQVKSLQILNKKLIEVVSNLNKSTAVQIADIKEDLK